MRVDLNKGSANILISDDEVKKRHAELTASGGFKHPPNQTPWQEIYRNTVGQQSTGACMELATRYQNVAGTFGVARDNHYSRTVIASEAKQSRDMSAETVWIASSHQRKIALQFVAGSSQ